MKVNKKRIIYGKWIACIMNSTRMTTLMYYINNTYKEHNEYYQSISGRLSYGDLLEIWKEMNSSEFGHAMAYLTLIYCSNISEECRRAAVRVAIPLLKSLDISAYIIRERSFWNGWKRLIKIVILVSVITIAKIIGGMFIGLFTIP